MNANIFRHCNDFWNRHCNEWANLDTVVNETEMIDPEMNYSPVPQLKTVGE